MEVAKEDLYTLFLTALGSCFVNFDEEGITEKG